MLISPWKMFLLCNIFKALDFSFQTKVTKECLGIRTGHCLKECEQLNNSRNYQSNRASSPPQGKQCFELELQQP